MIDTLILAGFAAWFLATAIYQIDGTPLERTNWYGLLLNCRFFCPHPAMTDTRAYYATSDEPSSAREALVWRPLIESGLPSLLPLWNPELRLLKSMVTLVDGLVGASKTVPPSGAHYTVPYLRLLNLATSASEGSAEPFTRFIVTEHRGRASPDRKILFESRTHAL